MPRLNARSQTGTTTGKRISQSDRDDFKGYLRGISADQVRGVYEKEKAANRRVYTRLAADEAQRRGVSL